MDPTRSVIRCVQALGRALRLDVSGKTASLIVPVYITPGTEPDNILGTPYEPVWAIACALASHDHRILRATAWATGGADYSHKHRRHGVNVHVVTDPEADCCGSRRHHRAEPTT